MNVNLVPSACVLLIKIVIIITLFTCVSRVWLLSKECQGKIGEKKMEKEKREQNRGK